jgi:NADPH:quinone reductase
MAKIVRFHRTGGPEVLQIDELDPGSPGPGEVRIRVKALGLNRAEAMFRSGAYLEAPKLPARLGYEASGQVEALGADVAGFAVGDAVSTIPAFSMNQYGVYGDTAIVPAYALAKNPPGLTWSQSTSIWMQYLTAYGALVEPDVLEAGDAVVITAASSSVGLAAIQIANQLGCVPIAATRTDAKRDALLAAGARHVVATQRQDLAAEVQRITDGKGARVAFDPVGGPGVETIASCMGEEGMVILYGALSPEPTPFPRRTALARNLTFRGYTLFPLVANPDRLELGRRFVYEGLAAGQLKPLIARSFELKDIVEAHRYMESNVQFGKIVVTA